MRVAEHEMAIELGPDSRWLIGCHCGQWHCHVSIREDGMEAFRQHLEISDALAVFTSTFSYFSTYLDKRGTDLVPANIPLHQGDMTSFDLGRQHDVVTCLFSAIGHLLSTEALHAGIARMAAHLEPGGLLMVEGWLTPDMWHDGHVSIEEAPHENGRVIRVTRSWREGRITTLEMHHFATRPPAKADYLVVTHQTALYSVDEYLAAFRAAGLKAWFDQTGLSGNGRGVYLGLKPLV